MRDMKNDCCSLLRAACALAGCLPVVLVVSTAGCSVKGPELQFVEGRVMLDGEPLGNATIGFTCTETLGAPPAYGVTDENGVYRLTSIGGGHEQGACVGTFVVTVSKFEADKLETGERGVPGGPPSGPPPQTRLVVPKVYADVATSPLRATVRRGANKGSNLDFSLERDRK